MLHRCGAFRLRTILAAERSFTGKLLKKNNNFRAGTFSAH